MPASGRALTPPRSTPAPPLPPSLPGQRFESGLEGVTEERKAELRAALEADSIGRGYVPVYTGLCQRFGWMEDAAKVKAAEAKIAEDLKGLDAKAEDAKANLGDTEVYDALISKANYLARMCAPAAEVEAAFAAALDKTVAVGHRLDVVFQKMVLAVYREDMRGLRDLVKEAQALLLEGGDWERRNKLKVYEALYHMSCRNFQRASELFLSSIATFTTTELFSYETFIFYTVVTSVITLERVDLKAKVVDAPEILTVIGQVPGLESFLNSMYECKYADFMRAFVQIAEAVRLDMYLAPHYRFFMREVRHVVYSQYLESYKSISLDNMAATFGVSREFIDSEIAGFIAAGKLACKIDRVSGILETTRPDTKNSLYQKLIKDGDNLLNRVQKLAKVIHY